MTDQTLAEQPQTYKLHDSTIAGLMQLLTLALGSGTNLLDHFRLLELTQGEDGSLVMTDDFIERTESLATDLMARLDEAQAADAAQKKDIDVTSFGFSKL